MALRPLLLLVPIWLVGVSACSPSKGDSETGGDPSASGGMSGGGATGSGGAPAPGGAPGGGGRCDGYETGDVELVRRCLERISCAPVASDEPADQDSANQDSEYSMSGCVTQAAAATPPCGVDPEAQDTATDCDTPDATICDGNLLIRCDGEGRQLTFDCSAAGLRCETDGQGAACLAPSCTFEDSDECTESCDGTRLRYCVGGSPTELDCTEFGFAGCEVTDARVLCVGEADPLADSCPFARDGECDPPPLCDEGTDTTDCSSAPPADEP